MQCRLEKAVDQELSLEVHHNVGQNELKYIYYSELGKIVQLDWIYKSIYFKTTTKLLKNQLNLEMMVQAI